MEEVSKSKRYILSKQGDRMIILCKLFIEWAVEYPDSAFMVDMVTLALFLGILGYSARPRG